MRRTEQLIQTAAKLGIRGPSPKGEYKVNCPFCLAATGSPDAKFKLQLSPSKGVYYCYKCGVGGRADLSWLGDLADVEDENKPPVDLGPPAGFVTLEEAKDAISARPYRRYLEKRNLLQQALYVGAGACLDAGADSRFQGRIIIPHAPDMTKVPKFSQSWRGFVARSIYDGVIPKYLYPTGMDRTNALWGGFLPSTDKLVLVEGVFDALAIYPHGVAAFGKNVTDAQLEIFCAWGGGGDKYVCLDGDAWEECAIIASRLVLRDATQVHWCKLPPTLDPGVLGMSIFDFVQGGEEIKTEGEI